MALATSLTLGRPQTGHIGQSADLPCLITGRRVPTGERCVIAQGDAGMWCHSGQQTGWAGNYASLCSKAKRVAALREDTPIL